MIISIRHAGFALLLLSATMIISGCLGPVKDLYPDDESMRPVTVYIVSHGWHAGIVTESSNIESFIPEHTEMPGAKYLMFEWGDGRYFPHEDPGFWLLVRAALWPTKSVIQVVGMDVPPVRYFSRSRVVKIQVTEEGMDKLGKFIQQRFRRNADGEVIMAADGLYRNSTFFEATGRYHLPKTSNTWTARALRQTGYPITPFYAFTSGNVIKQASKDGEVIRK
ncbi:DUF2459 domain-containing protein [Rhodohalobacter mucosus]|uniref:DUF2459 domain-containing protein n=1 Tax=Rhodohalobacter mucosus TaxID=2079485 RepID=A0A316TNQ3_9BACT|nr:DUF2459 domain-containing protein [Rhodohalobacter mucosus]PWN05408.1 hypothetical protein DDZ15_15185 [Rhodohalobacter mucosus]